MSRIQPLLVFTAVLTAGALSALAGGSKIHELQGRDALVAGELVGLSLDQEGVIRLGVSFDATPLDAATAWSAAVSGDDLWIGTGNRADLLRVAKDGAVTRISMGDGLLVTAVAEVSDGTVAAAVFPGAKLVKVTAEGETSTLAVLPAEHVWALASDGRGGLLAATGLPGAVFRIDAFGAVEKVAEVDDDHARCLEVRRRGDLLVGTAPKGRVVALKDGTARIIRDLDAQEVVGIVCLPDGGLLVAANADTAGGNPQMVASLLDQIVTPPETKPGQKEQPRVALQDGSVIWIEPSGAVTELWREAKVAALSLAATKDGAVLGTYPSGRLFHVAPQSAPALHADLPEAEASVVVTDGESVAAVVTSNPAVLHRRGEDAPRGTWTSAPVDAGATARWGRIRTQGSRIVDLAWRSGETEKPNASWTRWHSARGFDGGWSTDTTARFLQIRITLAGRDAELRGLSVVAAAPNQAPRITELTVERKGAKKKDPAPPAATPVRILKWKAEDPDGDRLRVLLHARRHGSPHWIPLVDDEVLPKPQHEWDTTGLPDGAYVIRLVVTDAPDNPADRARDTTRFTPLVRIDNTAPHLTVTARAAGDRLLVSGEAKDQPGGRIAVVRVSVDGGPWQVLGAIDGIYDETAEPYEGTLPLPDAGAHDVVVQARDAEGNRGAAATTLTLR